MHGWGKDSLILFRENAPRRHQTKPHHLCGCSVYLQSCRLGGRLALLSFHDSRAFFATRVEHYACMVDLLSHVHQLDEACELIKRMLVELDASVWGAFLRACRVYHNVELGEYVAEQLFKLEPLNFGNYILLSNIYTKSGRLDEAKNITVMIKERGVKKVPGCSYIEIKEGIHQFLVGDVLHPETKKIYGMLEDLHQLLRATWYVCNTCCALHD